MLSKTKPFLIMSILILFTIFVGCTPSASEPEAESIDAAQIYAAVIRQNYTVDDTYGGTLNAPIVYLIANTDDSVGDPSLEKLPSQPIDEATQQAIVAQLADLPAEWHWVDSRDDVPFDEEYGAVADDAVIISVGNIHPQEDGTVQVSSSIYIAYLAAGGQTYILEQVDGTWVINGTTGAMWIS